MGSFFPWTVISHFTSFLVYCGGCFDVLCLIGPVCPSLGNLVATLEGPPPDVRLCANQIGTAQYRLCRCVWLWRGRCSQVSSAPWSTSSALVCCLRETWLTWQFPGKFLYAVERSHHVRFFRGSELIIGHVGLPFVCSPLTKGKSQLKEMEIDIIVLKFSSMCFVYFNKNSSHK